MYNLVQNYENTYLFVTSFVQILLGIKFTRNGIVIIRWNEICKTAMRFNIDNLHSKRSAIENGKCPRTFNRGCIRAYRNKHRKKRNSDRQGESGGSNNSRKNRGRRTDCTPLEKRLYFTFYSGDLSKNGKISFSTPDSFRWLALDPLPHRTRVTFCTENFIFSAVNVTPSNGINVTRAYNAFARLFGNNRISGSNLIVFVLSVGEMEVY